MNSMQASKAHHIGSEPHPGFFPTINYEGGPNLSPETGPSDPGFITPMSSPFQVPCSVLNFASTGSRAYINVTDAGIGGGGTGGTGTGGTGTGSTGTGGTGTGGGTSIHRAGSGGTGVDTEHPRTTKSDTTSTGVGADTDTGGTGTTNTGTTTGVGSATGTGNVSTGGIRVAMHRLASLKLKRRNQFRGMRDRLAAGARSLIGNVQGCVEPTIYQPHISGLGPRDSQYVSDTREFDGLGIS